MLDPGPAVGSIEDTRSILSDRSTSSEENRIKVVCRVRPPVSRETQGRGTTLASGHRCVAVGGDKRTVTLNSKPQGKSFTFDYAAGEDSTQEELFAEVGQPVTEACLEGYNGTIFCYGQTGSGKTFTTFGPGAVMENHLNLSDPKSYELRGLVPRVLEYLYASIAKQVDQAQGKVSYACRCSFYEIFNEKVFDLVDESNRDSPMGLSVREDTRKGVYVEGLMEEEVGGADAACEILHRGFRTRHVGETAMNRESSRSHAVFTLVIEATEVVEEERLTRSRTARFNLVDLAGSERQKDTQASGERLKEASNINKSLSTLGQVINALVENSAGRFRHIPYRDSKLTFLLRDSLGGNSKTMLVAAISPADQNFGETASTLKFAQRAKMIKNQAVKNEDTSGSFDALRREVTTLRQKLLAAQQSSPTGGLGTVRRSLGEENVLSDVSGAIVNQGMAGTGGIGGDAKLEVLLANALRRARAAEEAQSGANRRVESLLSAIDKSEKDALQLKMVIKFRDGTIAAQRKKDPDQERRVMAEENAHLRKELEGGPHESTEVSKWRLQCKEAEARLAELTGGSAGDAKSLVWGVGDEGRFRGELDVKVVDLVERNRQLAEEADAFQDRLHDETKRAEKRRLSAANRAELEAKTIVENALLSKLQEAQGQAEQTRRALKNSEERIAAFQNDNSQLHTAVLSLKKQLDDANRKGREAVQERDVRLSDLQSKIEYLSREKVRAVEDSGSEVASLELKLATAIKDNGELLRRNRALEEEADSLDHDLDRLEDEKKLALDAGDATKVKMAEAVKRLEERMQQQGEVHERESDEHQAEKRSLTEDVEAVTERLKTAEEAHSREMGEQQQRSNDLQERLVETRAKKEEVEGYLNRLQDDYDTISQQAEFDADRADELDTSLATAAEDLRRAIAAGVARACATQHSYRLALAETATVQADLEDTERRLDGEMFFRTVQETMTAEARATCVRHEKEIENLAQEVDSARSYAAAISELSEAKDDLIREVEDAREVTMQDAERLRATVNVVVEESRVQAVDAAALLEVLDECQTAGDEADRRYAEAEMDGVKASEELEREMVACAADAAEVQARLRSEVETLELRIQEMEATQKIANTNLVGVHAELEATQTELVEAANRYEAQSQALKGLQTVASGMRKDLASAKMRESGLEASVTKAEDDASEARTRAYSLHQQLEEMRSSCFEFQARAVKAEERVENLSVEVTRLSTERDHVVKELARSAAELAESLRAADETRSALEAALAQRDSEKNGLETDLATLNDELRMLEERSSTLVRELENEVSTTQAELVQANEVLSQRDEEVASGIEAVSNIEQTLSAVKEELEVLRGDKVALEHDKTSVEKDKISLEKGLSAARSEVEEGQENLAASKKDLVATEKELAAQKEELTTTGKKLAAAVKSAEDNKEALDDAEARVEVAAAAAEETKVLAGKAAEASAEELKFLKKELTSAEERLSAEVAKLEAAETCACELQRQAAEAEKSSADMEQRLQGSEEQVARMQSEIKEAGDRFVEAEKARATLACRVFQLSNEVTRLEADTMSCKERDELLSEIESMKANLEDVTSRNTELLEVMDAMKEQTDGFDARVKELQDINVKLVGHKNNRQKIQQVQKLKDENNVLTRKVKELDDRLFTIKRSGCGPGCGRNNGNNTSASTSHSPATSPSARTSARNGGVTGGAGSAGKTYNLRRRGKTIDGDKEVGSRASGRRMGLRDMTNGN